MRDIESGVNSGCSGVVRLKTVRSCLTPYKVSDESNCWPRPLSAAAKKRTPMCSETLNWPGLMPTGVPCCNILLRAVSSKKIAMEIDVEAAKFGGRYSSIVLHIVGKLNGPAARQTGPGTGFTSATVAINEVVERV